MSSPTSPATAPRWRAVHRLAPLQRIEPRLAASTVGVVFGAELLEALRSRGLLDVATPAEAPAKVATPSQAAP